MAGADGYLRLVFVVDGLRPDVINPQHTPTIARLRDQGAECLAAHAAVPSVTRVNAAALVTGFGPGTNGLVGNQMYIPKVRGDLPFSTADGASVQRLGEVSGNVLTCPTLADRLGQSGLTFVSVGSGSPGSALLLNTVAGAGSGVMINTNLPRNGVPVAIPEDVQSGLLRRFGPPPRKAQEGGFGDTVRYATSVIREYVLPQLQPDVLMVWLTEPDHSQHVFGLGSSQAVAALRVADDAIAEITRYLVSDGAIDRTDIVIVSDHGFSTVSTTVDVSRELIRAGLKDSPVSTDVVVADTGCAALYVQNRDPQRIVTLVEHLQRSDWAQAVFTAPSWPQGPEADRDVPGGAAGHGWVAGTFSTGRLGYVGGEREADIVVSLPWGDSPNEHGIRGDSSVLARTGQLPYAAHHGNLSPHDIRSTLIGWGPSFRREARSEVPAGNLDVTPTLLHVLGVDGASLEGRILHELLAECPQSEPQVERWTERVVAEQGSYEASLAIARVDDHRYVSWATRNDAV